MIAGSIPRNLILAAATGYTWPQMEPFVRSLRRTAFSGDVVLLVGDLPESDARRLADFGIVVRRVHPVLSRLPRWWRRKFFSRKFGFLHRFYPRACDRLRLLSPARRRLLKAWIGRPFHHIACSRYFYYLSYLEANRENYGHIMLTDVRDVIFQDDPFAHPFSADLEFFLEHRTVTIGTQSGNSNWIRDAYGESALRRLADHRVSCSGITFGTCRGMLGYLAAMTDDLTAVTDRISGFDGFDQGVHNRLIWDGTFPGAALLENGRGPVLTMHGAPADEFSFDEPGRLLNDDGSVIAVLHQYDRHPEIKDKLLRRLAPPEPAQ